jgi:hypothetical protein
MVYLVPYIGNNTMSDKNNHPFPGWGMMDQGLESKYIIPGSGNPGINMSLMGG